MHTLFCRKLRHLVPFFHHAFALIFSWCFQITIIDDSLNPLGLSTANVSTSTESDIQSRSIFGSNTSEKAASYKLLIKNCSYFQKHIKKRQSVFQMHNIKDNLQPFIWGFHRLWECLVIVHQMYNLTCLRRRTTRAPDRKLFLQTYASTKGSW